MNEKKMGREPQNDTIKKILESQPLKLALVLILIYVLVTGNLRNNVGDQSPIMTIWLAGYTLLIGLLTRNLQADRQLGLGPFKMRRNRSYLIFLLPIPLVNLLAGFHLSAPISHLIFASISMLFVGFLEEVLMRGYLFEALRKDSLTQAVVISSLTFGIGHIVNLFTGQNTLETLLQIGYATSIGLVFALVLIKTGSLWPCIFIHSLMDVLSIFAGELSSQEAIWISFGLMVYCLGYAWCLWKKVDDPKS